MDEVGQVRNNHILSFSSPGKRVSEKDPEGF